MHATCMIKYFCTVASYLISKFIFDEVMRPLKAVFSICSPSFVPLVSSVLITTFSLVLVKRSSLLVKLLKVYLFISIRIHLCTCKNKTNYPMIQHLHSWVFIQRKQNHYLDIFTPLFIAALFVIAKTWKQPKCTVINDDKENVVYIHSGILFSHKKEWNPALLTWMDLEGILLSEINQTEKDKYHMISFICGNLKKPQTQRYREQISGCQRWEIGGGENGWSWSKRTIFSLPVIIISWGYNLQHGGYT